MVRSSAATNRNFLCSRREDLAGEASLDAVGFHDDKGAVHEPSTLHNPGHGRPDRDPRPSGRTRQRPASSHGTLEARASARAAPTT